MIAFGVIVERMVLFRLRFKLVQAKLEDPATSSFPSSLLPLMWLDYSSSTYVHDTIRALEDF